MLFDVVLKRKMLPPELGLKKLRWHRFAMSRFVSTFLRDGMAFPVLLDKASDTWQQWVSATKKAEVSRLWNVYTLYLVPLQSGTSGRFWTFGSVGQPITLCYRIPLNPPIVLVASTNIRALYYPGRFLFKIFFNDTRSKTAGPKLSF